MSEIIKPIVECNEIYKEYEFVVLFIQGGWRCGYVKVPTSSKYYKVDYNEIPIECHGGLTYGNMGLNCVDEDFSYYWIGFDCAHSGDKCDIESMHKYFENKAKPYVWWNPKEGKIMTKENCIDECHNIIDQLIELENE